jgi:hypothetical protein
MGGSAIAPSPAHDVAERLELWWHEVESAIRSSQSSRARRFLRWIVACSPDDEEAWLWLARLASSPAEQVNCLCQAYGFHPDSIRIQAALRQARAWQLESSVGELKPWPARVRCLPDERRGDNGNGSGSSHRARGRKARSDS